MTCKYADQNCTECKNCRCRNCWKAAKGKYCNKHWFATHGTCARGNRNNYIECGGNK